ncbi:Yhk8p NDAI_0D01680 [Naumovozyma dairenensis CBS 421]|uniref:Major facilitator superfamily (MFS) profile domain-containing protein n=1 Tax=Naumovozyma dairenensis (strain ATCC 10597 / BCRC 20456 / CBS 421 / NBRC 0211 / NRRL Y-12639) TaxID=1071378 RepID=G0W9M1_NAUDC|nr:hypothetical protein NDAI_0D01680 [Naumovozyma dairenensis CBS 421]CCD24482.1 hypothetical protein NDAI_0D01680 [Naumovozyma dairenensis CBS 421]
MSNTSIETGSSVQIESSSSTLSKEKHITHEEDNKDFEISKNPQSSNVSSFEVSFSLEGEPDPEDIARHLSTLHKYYIACVITFTSLVITIISSCWTFVSPKVIERYHISHEVSVLGITFYIFGLGFGPLFLSPISELYGRRLTFIFSMTLSIIWQCLTTWSHNVVGMMFGRFLSGFFGSAFLSIAGGSISDIFDKATITIPMSLYTLSCFYGPVLGPIVSGALYRENYRWVFATLLIASGVCLVLIIFTIPETYKPILLIKKAERMRKERGDERYCAPLERTRKESSFVSSVLLSSKRPFLLLFLDPMMGVLCFYTGLVLAIVYLYFVAFPYIFKKLYGFGVMQIACCYLGMMVGMTLAAPTSLIFQKRYEMNVIKNNNIRTPEMRFEPLFYGAFCCPIGLMIFAWTCYQNVHWMGPMIGSAIFGSGVFFVFVGVFNYTVDAYRRYAASGMACNSFVRSTMSGIFPLFGLQMYKGMGINWAGFLLAMVTILMIPVPFLFTKYGAYLRSKSPFAWDD